MLRSTPSFMNVLEKQTKIIFRHSIYLKMNTDLYFDCSSLFFSYCDHLENGHCLRQ